MSPHTHEPEIEREISRLQADLRVARSREVSPEFLHKMDTLTDERDKALLQNDEMREGETYDQQVRDDFAREFFGDQEETLWKPGLNLKKLLEMIRDKYIEKRVIPSLKCPACKCEHSFVTTKSHCDAFDYEGPCSACGQDR